MGTPEPTRRPTTRARELRNSATPAERRLWKYISRRQLGWKFSRQMPIGPFICDFLCREARLVVELDGGQHSERVEADASRTAYLEKEGFRVIRFWNNDVLERLEGVLDTITNELRKSPLPQASAGQRRGADCPRQSADRAGGTIDPRAARHWEGARGEAVGRGGNTGVATETRDFPPPTPPTPWEGSQK